MLYKLGANGQMYCWEAHCMDDGYIVEWGVVGGVIQEKFCPVYKNRSGRELHEQIELEMNSATNKKIDTGFRETEKEAYEFAQHNALNFRKPMLASPLKGSAPESYLVQYKYDGNRCLIHNNGRELVAYTRNGKRIDTIDHILRQIDIPTDTTLDGELYCHGFTLQEIVSWVKRKQPNTERLQFICYDQISSIPFIDRVNILSRWDVPNVAPTWRQENVVEQFRNARDNGYEGLILRNPMAGYEAGKRSKHLIKVKETFDDYFIIEDVSPSKDGWARLICTDGTAMRFTVSAPGRLSEREKILNCADQYKGRKVRVEYANKTKDGIPFHPVATLIV